MIITPPGLYLSVVNCWKVTEYLIQEILSRIDAQVSGGSRELEPRSSNIGIMELYHSSGPQLLATWHSDHCCYPWWDLITGPINGTLCREARQIHPLHCLRDEAHEAVMNNICLSLNKNTFSHYKRSLMLSLSLLILSTLVPPSLQSCCFLPAVIIPDCHCSEHRDGVTLGCRNLGSTR